MNEEDKIAWIDGEKERLFWDFLFPAAAIRIRTRKPAGDVIHPRT